MINPLKSLYSLEKLSKKRTFIHNLNPVVKIITTILYIFIACSFSRYNVSALVFLSSYPILISLLAEIPFKTLLQRVVISLPFCVFMGISGAFLNTIVALRIGNFAISFGIISFIVILFRMVLSVSAITILIATTPFNVLTKSLIKLKVPRLFILIIEMFYRYLGLVFVEKSTRVNAYFLRSNQKKGILLKNSGSFVGVLFIRNLDRAKKIYNAMKLRGYRLTNTDTFLLSFNIIDFLFLAFMIGFLVFARIFFTLF